ncbi:23934_t:CDS:2, partial [Gigaspora margarita]
GEEGEEDIFYIVQLCKLIRKLDQENKKKERSSKRQRKHKGNPSMTRIEVDQDHELFENLKIHLPAAPDLDDIRDNIWPNWALPSNYDDAELSAEFDAESED